jgi:integrase/recombinase XerC
MRWTIVGDLGKIRRRPDTGTFFLDFRPYGRLYRHRGIPITDEGTAQRLLAQIWEKVADGRALEEVLAQYQPEESKPNLISERTKQWLEVKRREADAGDCSPTYLRDLERFAAPEGYFSWWAGCTIYEIDYAALEDWSLWMADRGLAAKTRANALGAFRSFVTWLHRREELQKVPEFPWPKVDEHQPRILRIEEQDAILDAIPEPERGIFLALAHLGLRPGEARALEVADYRDDWLTVDKAVKGSAASAPIRGTKTRRGKRLPVGEELADWIEHHVDPAARLRRVPLFVNPRTGRRWSHWALRDRWLRAAKAAGIEGVRLYEGTKHTMATDAVRRGVSERALQRFLGHADVRSTRRYAKMADEALVSVLRVRTKPSSEEDLSRTCPADFPRTSNHLNSQGKLASPTGLEPVLPP